MAYLTCCISVFPEFIVAEHLRSREFKDEFASQGVIESTQLYLFNSIVEHCSANTCRYKHFTIG